MHCSMHPAPPLQPHPSLCPLSHIPSPLYPHSYPSLAALTCIEICPLASSFYLIMVSPLLVTIALSTPLFRPLAALPLSVICSILFPAFSTAPCLLFSPSYCCFLSHALTQPLSQSTTIFLSLLSRSSCLPTPPPLLPHSSPHPSSFPPPSPPLFMPACK